MKMKKKLYGILAFVLVALCALGFALGFTACSNKEEEDDKDPIIGTWQGNVEFGIAMEMVNTWISMGTAKADTTIYVDESTFALTIMNVDLGGMNDMVSGPLFTDEEYVAINGATWEANGDGTYIAYANVTGVDLELPIEVYEDGKDYILSLTADVYLSVQGFDVRASFENATIGKISNKTDGMPEVEEEAPVDSETECICGDGCNCEENCECSETCDCENCMGTSEDEKCTCGEDCACGEECECNGECACEDCSKDNVE